MRATRSKPVGNEQESTDEPMNVENTSEFPEEFDLNPAKVKPSKKPRVSVSTLSVAEQRKRALEFAERVFENPSKASKTSNPSSVHGTLPAKTVELKKEEPSNIVSSTNQSAVVKEEEPAPVITKPRTRTRLSAANNDGSSFDPAASNLSDASSIMTDASASKVRTRSTNRKPSTPSKADDSSVGSITAPRSSRRLSRRVLQPETILEEEPVESTQVSSTTISSPPRVKQQTIAQPPEVNTSEVQVQQQPQHQQQQHHHHHQQQQQQQQQQTIPSQTTSQQETLVKVEKQQDEQEIKNTETTTNQLPDHEITNNNDEVVSAEKEELDLSEILIGMAKVQTILLIGLLGYYTEFRYLVFTGVTTVSMSLFRRALFPSHDDDN